MKKLSLILSLIFVVVIVAVPIVVKNQFEQNLNILVQDVEKYGIKTSITKSEGYFNSKILLESKILDGVKFTNTILDKLVEIEPNYILFANTMKSATKNSANNAFNGITIESTLTASYLTSSDIKITLSLIKFSDAVIKELEKKKALRDFLKPILDEKMLTVFLTLDNQKRVKTARLNDLKLKVDNELDIQILENNLILDYGDRIKGTMSIGSQLYKNIQNYKTFILSFGDIVYTFDYLNKFNSKANISINNFKIEKIRKSRKDILDVKLFEMDSTVSTNTEQNLDAFISYVLQDLTLKNNGVKVTLADLKFDVDIKNISKQEVLSLNESYQKLLWQTNQSQKREIQHEMLQKVNNLLNKGLGVQIGISLNSIKLSDKELKDIDINFDVKLEKNDLQLGDRNFENNLAQVLDFNAQITMLQSDSKVLQSINRRFKQFSSFAKKELNKEIYDIDLQGTNIYINNKKL